MTRNTFSCIRIAAILIMAVSFSPQRIWGQSGSWADYQVAYTAEDKTINIANAGQLAKLAAVVNEGADFSGVTTINLSASIDLGEHYWVPIGTEERPFICIFNGSGHTISGLNITGTENNVGLFDRAVETTISNLIVSASSITGNDNFGVLAGRLIGCTITNCSVTDATGVSLANS